MHAALAMAATAVSLAFCLSTLERWRANHKPYELAWTISLAMYAAGSLALWWGGGMGWGEWSFKLFYLFGAILNVPFLAMGTVELLWGGRAARIWWQIVCLAAAFCAGVVLASPLVAEIPTDELPQGKEVFGWAPRVMAAVGSGVAATVIIVGAVWSAVRLLRGRRRPGNAAAPSISPGRLATANLLIAAGAMVNAAGGLLNSVMDAMDAFAVTLVAGIALIFTGFLLTGRPPARSADIDDGLSDAEIDWLVEELTGLVDGAGSSAEAATEDLAAQALR